MKEIQSPWLPSRITILRMARFVASLQQPFLVNIRDCLLACYTHKSVPTPLKIPPYTPYPIPLYWSVNTYPYLVGGLEHFLFFHILGIIIPTDELIFFRRVAQPPTSYGLQLSPRIREQVAPTWYGHGQKGHGWFYYIEPVSPLVFGLVRSSPDTPGRLITYYLIPPVHIPYWLY